MIVEGPSVSTVMRVLELVGPLAWGRFSTGSSSRGPAAPLLVWRYADEPAWAGVVLNRAIDSFPGRIMWALDKPRRNWVLWPERERREFRIGDWRTDSEYLVELAKADPDFCNLATSDLCELVHHLKQHLVEDQRA